MPRLTCKHFRKLFLQIGDDDSTDRHALSIQLTSKYTQLTSPPSFPPSTLLLFKYKNRTVGLPLVHDGGHLGRVQVRLTGAKSDGAREREARRIGEAACGVGRDSDDA